MIKTSRFLVLLLILVSACAQPTSSPTILPLNSPTPPPTKTRVPASPTAPAPSPTATSAPSQTLTPGAPWQQRASPRTLIDADDIARIKQWAATYAWARDARDQIIKSADAWPAQYLKDFNLTSTDPPPAGGTWTMWYICPNGLPLRYEPAHSPPHYCPSTNQYFASPPQWPNRPTLYDQVIYTRRHDALAEYARFLGLAYALTGNTKYAGSAATILRAYAAVYPRYPHHDKDGNSGASGAKAHAQTVDEAAWLIDLTWSYDLVSDALSPADRGSIADNLLLPAAAEIQGNPTGLSYSQTWHNAAIAAVGYALNDAELVQSAYDDPDNGFFKQLADGPAADGVWREGSWNYHLSALNAMIFLAEMGARAGIDTYSVPSLRAMWTAPLEAALPDLTLPRFNDDSGRTLSREWMYEISYNRYRDPLFALPISSSTRGWQALLWGAETLFPAGTLPATSILLDKAGYAILRAGYSSDPRYLAIKFGPYSGGPAHYDELGYIAFALGTTLGRDPGTHSLVADSHTAWDKTTVAHNALVVDEQNQTETTGNLDWFLGFSEFSLASANAGAAYPNRAAVTRSLALTPDYWIDLTSAAALDSQPHRFDWVYHNPGTLTTPLGLAAYTALPKTNGYDYLTNARSALTSSDWQATWDMGSSVRVNLKMLAAPNTTVVTGNGIDQTNQAIPFAMARRYGNQTTFTTLFEPYRLSPRITLFEQTGAGLRVSIPGVFEDAILLPDNTVKVDRKFDEFTTNAAAAYVRQGAAFEPRVLAVSNATKLLGGVRALLSSTVPVTLQVSYVGTTLAILAPSVPTAQLRIYASTSTRATVNGNRAAFKREGDYVSIMVP